MKCCCRELERLCTPPPTGRNHHSLNDGDGGGGSRRQGGWPYDGEELSVESSEGYYEDEGEGRVSRSSSSLSGGDSGGSMAAGYVYGNSHTGVCLVVCVFVYVYVCLCGCVVCGCGWVGGWGV